MATQDTVELNEPHAPGADAITAFTKVLPSIKRAIVDSRAKWDSHEPRMWSRAQGLTDEQLTTFDPETDLVEVRSGITPYGTVLLGKLLIPAVNDEDGEGFIHVRLWDGPNKGTGDLELHSIFTDEGTRDGQGHASTYRAIQTSAKPLEFFNE